MPRLVIYNKTNKPQPYRFQIERKQINIGRGIDNDIVIDCPSVSTRHSLIERIEGGYILRDLNSTNGIKLNKSLMEVIDLYDGLKVIIGDIPLEFQLSAEEIEQLSKEEYTSQTKRKSSKDSVIDLTKSHDAPRINAPAPRAAASMSPPQALASTNSGLNPFLVIILMAVAVFGGMNIRHYMDHQKLLLSKSTTSEKETPPVDGKETISPSS